MRSVFSPPQAFYHPQSCQCLLPARQVPQSLARQFFALGTEGTFVAYKVDDYLIIASDKIRSGEEQSCRPPPQQDPNSLIALETGVVRLTRTSSKWDGVKRDIGPGTRITPCAPRSPFPPCRSTEVARRIGQERMRNMSTCSNTKPRYRRHRPILADRNLRIDPVRQIDFVDRLRRGALPVSTRVPKNWYATSCP